MITKDPLVTKKMIATTRSTFGTPVNCISDIKEAAATYTSRAAEKLYASAVLQTLCMCLLFKEQHYADDFHHSQRPVISYTVLPVATSVTHELINPLHLVDRLFEEGKSYKKRV